MRKIITIALFLALSAAAMPIYAHPGRTDASGCHTNRKTGDYHCHKPKGNAAQAPTAKASTKAAKPAPTANAKQPQIFTGQVMAVADGDTITVRTTDFEQIKVRLYGIDAPEKNQPSGPEAGAYLRDMVLGKTVTITEIDVDRYSRTVGLVALDGASVNAAMVKAGLAWHYPRYCKIAVCGDIAGMETAAKTRRAGLWAADNPTPPWEWRRKK
jgi:endonuclease YncB( thermonuclease family)